MGYTYDKRRMPTMDSRTEQTANAPHQGMTASPMSNSAMLAYMGLDKGVGDPDLGTKIRGRLAPLRRIAEIPAAEREADTLSEGIKAQTPEQVKQEMGERLGSDFSSVRFHSDSSSVAQADSMGARAWAQGNDVFFGEGGFSPDVAAHELVHTVQQGVVPGSVSQSVPQGTIQMCPSKYKIIKIRPRQIVQDKISDEIQNGNQDSSRLNFPIIKARYNNGVESTANDKTTQTFRRSNLFPSKIKSVIAPNEDSSQFFVSKKFLPSKNMFSVHSDSRIRQKERSNSAFSVNDGFYLKDTHRENANQKKNSGYPKITNVHFFPVNIASHQNVKSQASGFRHFGQFMAREKMKKKRLNNIKRFNYFHNGWN